MTGEPPVLAFHTITNANIKNYRVSVPLKIEPGIYPEIRVPTFTIEADPEMGTLDEANAQVQPHIQMNVKRCLDAYIKANDGKQPKTIIIGHLSDSLRTSMREIQNFMFKPPKRFVGVYFIVLFDFENYKIEEIDNAETH
jgi:hypothetical protein